MDNTAATADSKTLCCATRYPLLLVHGVGVRDSEKGRAWGRIPQALQKHGAQVYFGETDAWGTPYSNSVQLLERLPYILSESGATKINIIAHSKGGLDSRNLIALFPQDEVPIASLTTLSTPHHGSRAIEELLSSVRPLFGPVAFVANRIFRALGDENPHFVAACKHLTPAYQKTFNTFQPSLPQVYSQQFGSRLRNWTDDIFSVVSYSFVKYVEGPNDGLVTLQSAAFDNYLGELSTETDRGVSHSLLVDAARRPFPTRKPLMSSHPVLSEPRNEGEGIALQLKDILDFYITLVMDLKARGY